LKERNLKHVDPTVFDNVDKLGYFWMEVVPCVKKEVYESRDKVLEMIEIVKKNCVSPQYLILDGEVQKLENESKTSNSEAFKTSLKTFDEKFSKSVYLNFRPLKNKYETLKAGQ
jgi:hypothetical protein